MVLLQQMAVLFLMMVVGFLCRKKGMLNDETVKKLSALVVYVANPALILSAGINKENLVSGTELAQTLLVAIGMYGVLILIAQFLPLLLRAGKKEYGAYRTMAVFSNIGFMGFPVISAVYGSEGLLYASLFLLPFNTLFYTYGIHIMKPSEIGKGALELKKIFNIGVIACLLSMAIYFFRIPIPVFIEDTASALSNLTAPLSMMIIGDSMTKINLRKLLINKKLMVFVGIKLLAIPLVGTLLIQATGCSPALTGVCMIILSMPVASMAAMLAQQYDNNFELVSEGVALTTLLSVATLPIVSMILGV